MAPHIIVKEGAFDHDVRTQINDNFAVTPSAWDSGTTYATGNVVTEWSGLWRAVDASTNSKPDSGNAHWTLISDTFTKVIDLDANQLRTNSSIPILAMSGRAGFALFLSGGMGQTTSGSISGAGTIVMNAYYEGDEIARTVQLLNDAVVDVDPTVVNPFNIVVPDDTLTLQPKSLYNGKGIYLAGSSDDATGGVATAVINDGGLGYAPGDTVTVDPFALSVVTVNTVGALGVATSITVTAPGYGGDAGTGQSTSALTGIGSGLTVNTTITPFTSTARVWLTVSMRALP